ncbi:hypothetical protein E3N88_14082 [Mikania micrantha]|uniref:Uncharacterized protein n=1 Tax=Mikania micrantha TaxID=192012 RepID=A0A5N6P0S8_9ASTR|nr:hypothetical protein E3N88_14082 [Mikania micrantha]
MMGFLRLMLFLLSSCCVVQGLLQIGGRIGEGGLDGGCSRAGHCWPYPLLSNRTAWVCCVVAGLNLMMKLGCGGGYHGKGNRMVGPAGVGVWMELHKGKPAEYDVDCLTFVGSKVLGCCMRVGVNLIGILNWMPPSNRNCSMVGLFVPRLVVCLFFCRVDFCAGKMLFWVGFWWSPAPDAVWLMKKKDGSDWWCCLLAIPLASYDFLWFGLYWLLPHSGQVQLLCGLCQFLCGLDQPVCGLVRPVCGLLCIDWAFVFGCWWFAY